MIKFILLWILIGIMMCIITCIIRYRGSDLSTITYDLTSDESGTFLIIVLFIVSGPISILFLIFTLISEHEIIPKLVYRIANIGLIKRKKKEEDGEINTWTEKDL